MNIVPILALSALVALVKRPKRDPWREQLLRALDVATTAEECDSLAHWAESYGQADIASAARAKAAALRAKSAAGAVISSPPAGGSGSTSSTQPVDVDVRFPPINGEPPAIDEPPIGGSVVELPEVVITAEVPRYFVVRNGDGGPYQIAGKFLGDSSLWKALRDAQPSATRRANMTAGKMYAGWRLKLPDALLARYRGADTRPLETYSEAVAVDGQVAE